MNCCDEFGRCQQSHGCPARTTPAEPEENLPWAWIDRLGFWWSCVLTGVAIGFGWGLGRLLKLF